jgi:hypothetical protein
MPPRPAPIGTYSGAVVDRPTNHSGAVANQLSIATDQQGRLPSSIKPFTIS